MLAREPLLPCLFGAGEFSNPQEVVAFYNNSGQNNALLSPLIRSLSLSKQEQSAIVAFLKPLTGSNVKVLVADACSVPIGDADHAGGIGDSKHENEAIK